LALTASLHRLCRTLPPHQLGGAMMMRAAAVSRQSAFAISRRSLRPAVAACVVPRRCFSFNIYEQSPQPDAQHMGTQSETAESIFLQHAKGEGGVQHLSAGQPFKAACMSLARVYPQLEALTNPALEGRAFELMNVTGDGVIDREEWITGVANLLDPIQERYKNLAKRLGQGFTSMSPSSYSHVKRVAIIGGGVAGLQTARALTKRGKEVVIFEKTDNVGGVWKANYDNFGLQVPRELYEFPEFPYPANKSWAKFPSGPEVQEYIERYADHFGLRNLIRFSTGVSRVDVGEGGKGWTVFSGKQGEVTEPDDFDFVVVATGMYGWPPHIPKVRGQETFEGEVYHSANFFDAKLCEGRDVVVVGGGKSAVDNAVSGARLGKSSTLLFREGHWPVPRHLLNLVPFKWGTYSRFGHFMLPAHHELGDLKWYMHSLLTPVKWIWWRIVELMFRAQFRLSGDLVPETRIEHDLFSGGQILNYDFRDLLKQGKVKAIKGSIEFMHPKHVELQSGEKLPCDLLVFGTGFAKSYNLFDRLVQEKLAIQSDGLYLFRNIIPPNVANLAFIGCEVSTFNNILTHALQAEWLARLLDGTNELPERRRMLRRIEQTQTWKRSWMPPTSARAAIWQLHMLKYHDGLLKDMGEKHLRKGPNVLAEVFAPYSAADYRDIFK